MLKKCLILLLLVPISMYGQKKKRLQPGKLYEAGEQLYAPHFGFLSTVPANWTGILPRETEVFLLSATTMPAEIYVFGREQGDLETMKKEWEKGVALDANLKLISNGAAIANNMLTSEVKASGPSVDKNKKGYAAARCGDSGKCVICLAVVLPQSFDATKKVINDFLASSRFEAPSDASPYADFEWMEFLPGKALITLLMMEDGGSKESRIDLCKDGTFKAKISKRGILKNQNPQYKGNLSGTWTAEGVGDKGKLTLTFKGDKLAPLSAELVIKDEQIWANGERYFAGESDKCTYKSSK